jgi:hypothetical protein
MSWGFTADQLRAAVLADRAESERVLRVALEALSKLGPSGVERRLAADTIRAHLGETP